MNFQPIETHYNGYRFRSRLEARWAVFFDTLGIKYDYEPDGFPLEGFAYLPDFYLYPFDCWFEVKGPGRTKEEYTKAILKAEKLSWYTKKVVFMFSNCWLGLIKETPFSAGECPNIVIENFGYYWTPDGDYDGMMAFGFCPICHTATLGHVGGHWIHCTNEVYEVYKGDCKGHTLLNHPYLMQAYTSARQARFEHGEKPKPKPILPVSQSLSPLPQKTSSSKDIKPTPLDSVLQAVIKTFSAQIVDRRETCNHPLSVIQPSPVHSQLQERKGSPSSEIKPFPSTSSRKYTNREKKELLNTLTEFEDNLAFKEEEKRAWKDLHRDYYDGVYFDEDIPECACGQSATIDNKCVLCGSPMCLECAYLKNEICQSCIEMTPCTDCKGKIALEHSCRLCNTPLCTDCYTASSLCDNCYKHRYLS